MLYVNSLKSQTFKDLLEILILTCAQYKGLGLNEVAKIKSNKGLFFDDIQCGVLNMS